MAIKAGGNDKGLTVEIKNAIIKIKKNAVDNIKKKKARLFTILVICFLSLPLFPLEVETAYLQNGIPVIVKPSESRMFSIAIVVKGGAAYLNEETSGLEDATFSCMCYASKKYSKDKLDSLSYNKGFSVSCSATQDSASLKVTCIDKYTKTALDVLCNVFTNPAFTDEAFNLVIDDIKSSLAYEKEDPKSMLRRAVSNEIYANHPYKVKSFVTDTSFPAITKENMIKMHKSDMDSRRIFIVASGNITSSFLASRLKSSIGKIPALDTPLIERDIPPITPMTKNIVLFSKALDKTGFMQQVIPGPAITDNDALDTMVASVMYSRQLFNVVREANGVCYSTQSICSLGKIGITGVYLYDVSDKENAIDAVKEASKLLSKGELVSSKDDSGFIYEDIGSAIEGVKNTFLNSYYEEAVSSSSICGRMAYSILTFGDPSFYDNYIMRIRSVTDKAALAAFNKYWTQDGRWFTILGPTDTE